MNAKWYYLLFILALLNACRDEDLDSVTTTVDDTDYSDWSEATHGNVDPDYDIVFDQENVLRFDITIDADDWSDMQSNLSSVVRNASFDRSSGEITISDPDWYECSFSFDSLEWYHVGIRYKGNSSLVTAYNSGVDKLSFKLDFDEFEDDYPAISDQRFYGF